ncbi:MAG: SPOR domain-containing protein [FCB group bacterium]|jgi:hypothetical protein
MANIDENMLRDEELSGGFKPGDPDDETFMLREEDEYPGNLPEFITKEPEKQSTIEEPIIQDEKPEKNVNTEQTHSADNSSIKDLREEPEDISKNETIPETAEHPAFEEKEEIPVETEITQPLVEASDEGMTTLSENLDIVDEEPVTTDINADGLNLDALYDSNLDISGIIVDDDLSQMLKSELDRTSDRREKAESSNEILIVPAMELSSDELNAKLQDFKPVEDVSQTEFIDISKIQAERPSTFGQQPIPNESEILTEENAVNVVPIILPSEKKKPKKEKPVKEKVIKKEEEKDKSHTIIPWWIWGVSTAAVLILGAIGFSTYQFYLKPMFKSIAEKKETIEKPVSKIEKPAKPVIAQPRVITPPPQQPVTEAKTNLAITKEIEKPVIKIEKKIIKPKPIHAFEKSLQAKKPKPQYASVSKTESIEKPYSFHTKQGLSTFLQSKQAQFAVQIYTSLSKEDAEEWLMRLKNKNVTNAFLSTQRIRDKIWYRVRFGPFDTREDAESEALKLGFAQSWIDRVR